MTAVFFRAQCVSSLAKNWQKIGHLPAWGWGAFRGRKMPGKPRELLFDWEGARRGCACRECGHMRLSPAERVPRQFSSFMSSTASPRGSTANHHHVRGSPHAEGRGKAFAAETARLAGQGALLSIFLAESPLTPPRRRAATTPLRSRLQRLTIRFRISTASPSLQIKDRLDLSGASIQPTPLTLAHTPRALHLARTRPATTPRGRMAPTSLSRCQPRLTPPSH